MKKNFVPAFAGFAVTYSLAVPLALTLNAVLSRWSGSGTQPKVIEICWILAGSGLISAVTTVLSRRRVLIAALAFLPALLGALALVLQYRAFAAGLAVLLSGAAMGWSMATLKSRLAGRLETFLDRSPWSSALWVLLLLLVVIQSGRLGAFMADDTVDWWLTTRDPLWAKHMCLPAFLHAVDLHRQGEANIYEARHYPVLVRSAQMHLTVKNMEAYAGDPYQYPPQFLLLPRLALWLTNDFLAIRTVWYGVQLVGFVLIAFLLAAWVQAEAEIRPFLLIPLVWVSVPSLQCLQFGQFHLAALCLSVGAMLAFEYGRDRTGGALLAVATLSKIFPGVLILLLVIQKKWRGLIWTGLFLLFVTLATLVLFGTTPFHAFVGYQLPRLASGEAFDFTREWPEIRDLMVANNISPFGLVAKLSSLSVPGMSHLVARLVAVSYSVLLLVLVVLGARVRGSRQARALLWLALLNLAALQSPAAWGDYVPVGTVWLLSLVGVGAFGTGIAWKSLAFATWIFSVSLLGIVPMPFIPRGPIQIGISAVAAILILAFNVSVVLTAKPRPEAGISKR